MAWPHVLVRLSRLVFLFLLRWINKAASFLFNSSDKMFPAFGFGARIPPEYTVSEQR